MWQDYALAAVSLVFAPALLPAILGSAAKPPRSTCAVTAIGITVIVVVNISLELYFAAGVEAGTAISWFILLCQPRSKS